MKIIGAVLYELCIELLYNFNQLYFTRKLNNHWFFLTIECAFPIPIVFKIRYNEEVAS